MQDIYYSNTGIYYKSIDCVAGTSINTTNQTSDILQHPMNNIFIMYCSCVNTIQGLIQDFLLGGGESQIATL